MKYFPLVILFFLIACCTPINKSFNRTDFYPGIFEMEVKGTVFETLYNQRFIYHYRGDGSYLCQHFEKNKLTLESTGTYQIRNDELITTSQKWRFLKSKNPETWSEWNKDIREENEKIRNITPDSFELYISGVHENEYYWQKFSRLSVSSYNLLIE